MRTRKGWADACFAERVAKYVRHGHIQTTPDFARIWRKAALTDAPAYPRLGALRLPPLPLPDGGKLEAFSGPTRRSNWGIPGALLAGDRSSLEKPAQLVAVGVSAFVSLQQKHESPPYEPRVRELLPSAKSRHSRPFKAERSC